MTTRLTIFTATLVQDSAISVSGIGREASADQPFAMVKGVPTLVGRGIKGAAVAMAGRFFDPLPRSVSDNVRYGSLRRSVWEFSDATSDAAPRNRANVGIRQKTGARAEGVLFDREVIPSGTRWDLTFRVDRSHALDDQEFEEAEGILGYVLAEHWAKDRCWLGGGVSRGLGWCHIEFLHAFRLDGNAYETWVTSGRKKLPPALDSIPKVTPTRSWCFRTLDLDISFGEYRPDGNGDQWGLDMFTVGPHDAERAIQDTGNGEWAWPAWSEKDAISGAFSTDRALLMEGGRPLLPGASVRGPLRHASSRAMRASGAKVEDPNQLKKETISNDDPAGEAFGTTSRSSRILIRDARADEKWSAAKLHMHAEDEFSAGTFGSSKRDSVRMLRGKFRVRILIEGATSDEVKPLMELIDKQVALGEIGHLPIGGHKTRGAGWGTWKPGQWLSDDVEKARDGAMVKTPANPGPETPKPGITFPKPPENQDAWLEISPLTEVPGEFTLGKLAELASRALEGSLVAWWCDPTVDFEVTEPPITYGEDWPQGDANLKNLKVDEVVFFAQKAVWRAARTAAGARSVLIAEVPPGKNNAKRVTAVHTPARLHGFRRFSSARIAHGAVLIRQWHTDDEVLGFTLCKE